VRLSSKIVSLYTRGMTVREIQRHLAELSGTAVSPDLISSVTDAVLDEVREWQKRPLDPGDSAQHRYPRSAAESAKPPPAPSQN